MTDILTDTVTTANNKVVVHQRMGLYEGPIAVECEKLVDPLLQWHGSPISTFTWRAIVGFMRWTNEEFNSEAQLRLYYNQFTSRWKPVVLPQWVSTGMTSKEIADHADRDAVFAGVAESDGWFSAGTIHHHCSAVAFQSSVDERDELDQNGLHITLGQVNQVIIGIHARATFRRVSYSVDLNEWIEPSELELLTANGRFPNSWRAQCLEKPKPVQPTYSTYFNWRNRRAATAVQQGPNGLTDAGTPGFASGYGYGLDAGDDDEWGKVPKAPASTVEELFSRETEEYVDSDDMTIIEKAMASAEASEMFVSATEMMSAIEAISDASESVREATEYLGNDDMYEMLEVVAWYNTYFDGGSSLMPYQLYGLDSAARAYDAGVRLKEDPKQGEEGDGGTISVSDGSGDTTGAVDSPLQLVAGRLGHGDRQDVHGAGGSDYAGPVPPRCVP